MSLKTCFFSLFTSWFCIHFVHFSQEVCLLYGCKSSSSCSSRLFIRCETSFVFVSSISTLFLRVWTFIFSSSTISFNEAISSVFFYLLRAPDRFERVRVSALFVVGDGVDSSKCGIFHFAWDGFAVFSSSVKHFK